MNKFYLQLLLVFITIKGFGFKNKDVFGTRVFVENKGQFDKLYITDEKIKFGYEHGDEKIYFTNKGLVYVQLKRHTLTEDQKEAIGEGEETNVKPTEVYKVYANWKNANSSIQIIEEEKQTHYFTYGEMLMKAYGYKKITYKNVYDHIDIEYIIPEDKEVGIKYNVILHPGANPSKIKIAYSGDVNDIQKNNLGEIVISTPMEPIVEHTPHTFNKSNEEIKCEFSLDNNKIIGFDFEEKYNSNEEVTIDPWVTNITSLTANLYGYDVDFDNFGNLFVYGGSTPNKLAKYNSVGTLLWTFSGVLAIPAWNSGSLAGNFVVKRTTGQSFLGQGIAFGGTQIIRLDPNGVYNNLISIAVPNWLECWDMGYHCTTGNVFGLGGAVPSNLSAGILDQITGSITPINFFGYATGGHDVVSHSIDNTGEVYLLFASVQTPNLNNHIAKINSAFTSSVWIVPSTFNTMNEANNKIYVGGNNGSNGFNALASNGNYLFYYDGSNVSAYNKVTGAILGSTIVTGYTPKQQGGIAVDDCNNIYVGGSSGNLLSFHFTGTTFLTLPGINLNVNTANQYVCDIQFDKPSNLLYVSGSGFCGTFNAINSATCPLVPDCNYTIPNSNTIVCLGAVATVSIGNPNNLGNPSYSIQPAGQTQSSPIFTVSPSVTTTYTLYVTGLNSSNIITTNTAIATVTIAPVAVTSISLTNGTCVNPTTSSVNLNISFNPSGNPNYTTIWSPVPSTVNTVNSPTAAGLVPGTNNVTITTSDGCVTVVSFSVPPIPVPANFIVTNPGGTYTLTCSVPNIVLTTSITNGNILTYTWFPSCTGSVVGNSMNFTQPCTGNVVGTSSTGCTHTETYTIYQDLTSPTIVVTPTVLNITCGVSPTTFTGTSNLGPNVTTNWFQVVGSNTVYVGVAGGTVNIFQPGQPGIYWFESIYNITGCKKTMSVQVTASIGVPIFTVTSTSNFTIGCASTSITSMQVSTVITSPVLNVPVNYAFVVPPGTAIPVYTVNPNLNNITIPGTYVVYVKDLTNNCVSSESISIIQNTIAPNIDFIQPLSILSCKDPSMVLNGISTNTNVTITWTVPAIPSNSVNPTPNTTVTINPAITNATNNVTAIGFYTVGAVDNNNQCRATKTVQINQDIRLPKFTISALTNSVINCMNPDVVIVPIVTPSLAVALVPTYIWYPPVGPGVPGTQYNTTSAGSHTSISTSVVNGCTYIATYVVAADFNPPAVTSSPDFTLDCATNPTVALFPSITGLPTGFTYSWVVPAGALTSNLTSSLLVTNLNGEYLVVITNTLNGCITQAFLKVVGGGIHADFVATPDYGFAPLSVTFNNTSATSTGASSIISTWSYGNGAITQTVYNTSPTSALYEASGTYSVLLTVQKGTCIDTAMHTIIVDLPSKLEIPNVFTPNGDKSNDIFRLRSTNLTEVYIIIFDRWGDKVYELTSETGNFAWDGKNQSGKDCAAGTFFYLLKATGKDKQTYDLRGNVSLFR